MAEASTLDAALAMVGREVRIAEAVKEELVPDCGAVVGCADATPLRPRPARQITR